MAVGLVDKIQDYGKLHLNGIVKGSVTKSGEFVSKVKNKVYTSLKAQGQKLEQHSESSTDFTGNNTDSLQNTCTNNCPVSMINGKNYSILMILRYPDRFLLRSRVCIEQPQLK
ncbi:hypothetical protein Q8W13_05130 [Photobacterium damselae subsp. piscicida]|nr:hypothetical protein [Photobacterium damselae subsp. piscicida]